MVSLKTFVTPKLSPWPTGSPPERVRSPRVRRLRSRPPSLGNSPVLGATWNWPSERLQPFVGVEAWASPFTWRKADRSPFLRELIIPFGLSGYVALFEIIDPTDIVVSAVRHLREEDCH
jgi:hypothetical protein